MGADGGIGTTCTLRGRLCVALAAAHRAGDLRRAEDLQAVSAGVVDALLPAGVLPG
jgi:N-acetylneuraminate lyase